MEEENVITLDLIQTRGKRTYMLDCPRNDYLIEIEEYPARFYIGIFTELEREGKVIKEDFISIGEIDLREKISLNGIKAILLGYVEEDLLDIYAKKIWLIIQR